MYACLYLTMEQQRCCAYQSYVYNESETLTQDVSTSPRRAEPAHTCIESPPLVDAKEKKTADDYVSVIQGARVLYEEMDIREVRDRQRGSSLLYHRLSSRC